MGWYALPPLASQYLTTNKSLNEDMIGMVVMRYVIKFTGVARRMKMTRRQTLKRFYSSTKYNARYFMFLLYGKSSMFISRVA